MTPPAALPSLKDWILLILGIVLTIIVERFFKDSFYLAIIIAAVVFIVLLFVVAVKHKILGIILTIVVSSALIYFHWNAEKSLNYPAFEINFIGLPNSSDTSYYVTDSLIRTQGDLKAYNTFTLSPISVEVVPSYLGDEKYGNIILRVSGDSSSKDFPLWTDFDKSAQTQTVKIDLADILKVSGIKQNREEENTNLMLGGEPFQKNSIKFAVMRLSEPSKPFDSSREILVKNTPWKQEVSIVWRNDWFVDYALTNLGAEAKFYCRANIAKTLSDVSVSDHSFWSGATIFSYGPNCDPFTLKTGETYKVSMQLNKDTTGEAFTHGRYLVQVYTFAERNDITFSGGHNYEDSSDMWLFANAGNVETFVICNDPGMTCEQTDTLPVEDEIIRAFPYNSKVELDNGTTYFWVRTYPANNRSTNQYILDYWLDPQRDGWAGFGIWFENLVDVSTFNSIRFKLILDKSLHPISLDVKGKVDDTYKTSRVAIGDGKYGNSKAEEQTIIVPFSAFVGIDWTKVDTLHFVIDSNLVPDSDQHQIRISEIEFIR